MVISDCWVCIAVSTRRVTSSTVSHSFCFKDPKTGAHTNTIEGTWHHVKVFLEHYTKAEDYRYHLAHYMFAASCRANGKAPFLKFVRFVASKDWAHVQVTSSADSATWFPPRCMHLRIQVWSWAIIIIRLQELPTLRLQRYSCYFSPHLNPHPFPMDQLFGPAQLSSATAVFPWCLDPHVLTEIPVADGCCAGGHFGPWLNAPSIWSVMSRCASTERASFLPPYNQCCLNYQFISNSRQNP